MKYTIEGFNQEKAIEYELDMTDLFILRWIVDFSPKMTKKQIDNQEYFWVKYQAILDDLPILKIKKRALEYRLEKLTKNGILKHQTVKLEGTFAYYSFGDNYEELLRNGMQSNAEGYATDCEKGMQPVAGQNNPSTINNNNICQSNDEQDSDLQELADNFDKIWRIYPRKDGKNTAFNHYKAWLKGKKYAGRTVKLDNRQMWLATKKYADLIEKNKTEKQYIKMGSTFFNEAIMEFVEEENED